MNPKKPDGVYDEELHNDAITTTGWETIIWIFESETLIMGTANIGYHAKWVRGEGRDGGVCIKFVDRNAVYRNDSQWRKRYYSDAYTQTVNYIKTTTCNFKLWCNSTGVDLFYITYFQKTSDVEKAPI